MKSFQSGLWALTGSAEEEGRLCWSYKCSLCGRAARPCLEINDHLLVYLYSPWAQLSLQVTVNCKQSHKKGNHRYSKDVHSEKNDTETFLYQFDYLTRNVWSIIYYYELFIHKARNFIFRAFFFPLPFLSQSQQIFRAVVHGHGKDLP